jgi:hypothetical protein
VPYIYNSLILTIAIQTITSTRRRLSGIKLIPEFVINCHRAEIDLDRFPPRASQTHNLNLFVRATLLLKPLLANVMKAHSDSDNVRASFKHRVLLKCWNAMPGKITAVGETFLRRA